MPNVKNVKVKAKKGMPCPMEGSARKQIGDSFFMEVPLTVYYRRLISDGSLEVEQPKEKEAAKKATQFSTVEEAKIELYKLETVDEINAFIEGETRKGVNEAAIALINKLDKEQTTEGGSN